MNFSQRAANIKPSATLALANKAKEMKAQGIDVINLSVGEPDFKTPAHIKQAAIEAIQAGKADAYTAATGILPLREAKLILRLRMWLLRLGVNYPYMP